mgnify:CR=1 FL=1
MKIGGAIPIAKIVGAHGLHGTCKVHCYGECGEIFGAGRDIFIKTADGVLLSYEIDWAKPHARTILLALKGITDRSHTDKLIGCDIMIEKSNLPVLPAGTYYWLASYSGDDNNDTADHPCADTGEVRVVIKDWPLLSTLSR